MKRIKYGGRKVGTPNKINQEVKDTIKQLFDSELEAITPQLNKLPLKDRIDFLTKLLPYLVPKFDQGGNTLNNQTIVWNETKTYEQPPFIIQVDGKDLDLK